MDRRHPARPNCLLRRDAQREAVGEQQIRLLAPLALLSPRIIAAIADGTAPADLTVTGLAKALPYSWAGQERAILQNT
jgi:site-specific DNA recombinase